MALFNCDLLARYFGPNNVWPNPEDFSPRFWHVFLLVAKFFPKMHQIGIIFLVLIQRFPRKVCIVSNI